MGFNFRAGSPVAIFGDDRGEMASVLFQAKFGPETPLGDGAGVFRIPDEIGWPWWRELQQLAEETLGTEGSKHIQACDAWHAVYLDADVDRTLLWLDGKPTDEELKAEAESDPTEGFDLDPDEEMPPEVMDQMREMMQMMTMACGARSGESRALQVASLRGLMGELDEMLDKVGVARDFDAVDAKRTSYLERDETIEAEPAIQALCHAWMTASEALNAGVPMWLLK